MAAPLVALGFMRLATREYPRTHSDCAAGGFAVARVPFLTNDEVIVVIEEKPGAELQWGPYVVGPVDTAFRT